jgi:uncharacterized protein (DUF1499 family)
MRLFLAAACAGQEPDLSLVDGHLRPCPASPNCVSSEEGADAEHAIAPLAVPPDHPPAEALAALEAAIAREPRTAVLHRGDAFLHVTYRTALLRFVDDVTFRVDPEAGVIHVRSASRVGQGDLGVNRRRVEALRTAFGG